MRWRLAARSGPAAAGHGEKCYGSKHGFPTLDSVRDYFEVASAPGRGQVSRSAADTF